MFDNAEPERVARFFDDVMAMGIDGISLSPGYAYERAPDQQHFLNRTRTKQLFRDIFSRALPGQAPSGRSTSPPCSWTSWPATAPMPARPWGNPCRTYFGWQRPCYLLGEGYTKTYKELMETTEWDKYGTGNYEKCADCMVHSGYEATAVAESIARPLELLKVGGARYPHQGPDVTGYQAGQPAPGRMGLQAKHVDDAMARLTHKRPAAKKVEAEVEPAE